MSFRIRKVSLDLGRIVIDRPVGDPITYYLEREWVPGAEDGMLQLTRIMGRSKILFIKGLRKEDPCTIDQMDKAALWIWLNLPEYPDEVLVCAFRGQKWEVCKRKHVNCHVDDRLDEFAAFPPDRMVLKILFDPNSSEIEAAENVYPGITEKLINSDDEIERFRSYIWRKIIVVTRDQGWPRILEIIGRFRPEAVRRAQEEHAP